MSFDRLRSQYTFESFFGGNTSQQWLQGNAYIQYQLSQTDAITLANALRQDVYDLYFKGSVSICEAMRSIDLKLYSWATIKLYYSIFYFLRCTLACNNVSVIRRGRELFYIRARQGESLSKAQDRTDHKGTIYTFMDIYGNSDVLQSNSINGINPYIWMMGKRDEVNYKDREFHDPDAPYFWKEICDMIEKQTLDNVALTFISDTSFTYTFQEDYSCLALPLMRMVLTRKVLSDNGIISLLHEIKKSHLSSILPFNNTNIGLFEYFMI